MRYSISNAIPHNPKSEKHPYENLVKKEFLERSFISLYKAIENREEAQGEEVHRREVHGDAGHKKSVHRETGHRQTAKEETL